MELTAKEVFSWSAAAKPGSALVYRAGPHLQRSANDHSYSDAVHAARYLYNRGLVDLVQRRLSSGPGSRFEYMAVKRRDAAYIMHDSRFHVPDRIVDMQIAAAA